MKLSGHKNIHFPKIKKAIFTDLHNNCVAKELFNKYFMHTKSQHQSTFFFFQFAKLTIDVDRNHESDNQNGGNQPINDSRLDDH